MKLTPEQIAGYVQVAGPQWQNPQAMAIAVAIALGESGGETTATNSNTNGSVDHGLFQINSVHTDILKLGDWKDPDKNAKMAYQVYLKQGFSAWTVYKTGKYLTHMSTAIAAARNPAKVGTQTPPSTNEPVNPPSSMNDITGITTFLKVLSDPTTWVRVGMFIGGTLLLGIALIALIRKTSVGKLAENTLKAFVTKKVPV